MFYLGKVQGQLIYFQLTQFRSPSLILLRLQPRLLRALQLLTDSHWIIHNFHASSCVYTILMQSYSVRKNYQIEFDIDRFAGNFTSICCDYKEKG